MSELKFQDLGISPVILQAIDEMGYKVPSEIQAKSIPILLDHKKDFVGLAQTGTGKTAAFGIPLLEKIDPSSKDLQAMILTPTRELANQVEKEITKFGKYTGIRTSVIYGGVSYDRQLKSLKNDRPQIVVGTPGRVIDLIEKKYLKVDNISTCVLDEADEMLNMGFFEDVQKILALLKNRGQLLMFSATMPSQIKSLIEKNFNDHSIVTTKSKIKINTDIEQKYFVVKDRFETEALARLIESIPDVYGMVFCKTKIESKEVGDVLARRGLHVDVLNGDMNQRDRDFVMKKFKQKRIQILVCTDVAARGIDVNNLTHVFNYGLAQCDESYVHRIGRTGRAGQKGAAYTIICPRHVGAMRRLESFTKSKIALGQLPSLKHLRSMTVSKEISAVNDIIGKLSETRDPFLIEDDCFDTLRDSLNKIEKDDLIKLMYSWKFRPLLQKYDKKDVISLTADEVAREHEFQRRRRGKNSRFGRSHSRGSQRSRTAGRSPNRGFRKKSKHSGKKMNSDSSFKKHRS